MPIGRNEVGSGRSQLIVTTGVTGTTRLRYTGLNCTAQCGWSRFLTHEASGFR
jgi:hypothetical protein